jgi:hypothetical protein
VEESKTFSFATPQPVNTPAFGSSNGLTPASFSFGKTEQKKESPKKDVTFAVSPTSPKSEAPKFSFNSTDKPTLSFGGIPVNEKKEQSPIVSEKKEQPLATGFTFNEKKTSGSTTITSQNGPSLDNKGLIIDYGKAVRSLNVSILSALQDQLKKESLVNLIPLFDDYGKLWKELESKHASAISLLNKSNDAMEITKSPQSSTKTEISSSIPSVTQNAPPKFSLIPKVADDKPAFSFSAPKEFSFGSPAAQSTTGFNISPTKQTPATGFTFGSTPASKIAPVASGFSLSAPNEVSKEGQSSVPPTFSFAQKTETPKFTFGTPATGGFTFGKSAETSQAFSFKSSETPAASKEEEEAGEDEDATITAGGINEDLMKGSELENETMVHEVKSKLNVLDKPQPGWNTVGVGMVRLLKHKETGKVRLLCRSEGAGRILLNIAIFPQMIITSLSPTMVQFAAVEDGKITKYLAKVKTANEATELMKALEKVKAEL